MKTFAIFLLAIAMLIISPQHNNAQEESGSALGFSIKASTNGFGGELIYGINKNFNLRLGGEGFSYDRDISFNEQDIDYEAVVDSRIGSVSLLIDYTPAPWFFLSGGLGYNLFHGNVVGEAVSSMPFGDIEIPKERIGDFEFDILPSWKISPYLGIGFGRTLSLNHVVGFAFELGTFYQGPPDIGIKSTGLLSPTSNPDHGQEARLERQIDQYYLYPVMRFSLSFRIVQF